MLVIIIGVKIACSQLKFVLSACEQSLPDRKVELVSVGDHLADLALRACDLKFVLVNLSATVIKRLLPRERYQA